MINDSLLSNMKSMNVGVPPIKTIEEMFNPVEGANLDSWFFIGRSKKDGHDLSFLLHFIIMTAGEGYSLNTLLTVMDKATGWHSAEDNYAPLTNQVRMEDGKLLVQTEKGSMSADLEQMHLTGRNKDCSVDVEVTPKGYVMNNGGSCYFPIMVMKENYHYSLPFFTMAGKLTLGGETYEVEGDCWLDRQTDMFKITMKDGAMDSPGQWTWLGIYLDNKTALSIWDYTDRDGRLSCFATVMGENGRQAVYTIDSIVAQAEEVWVGQSGNRYPTKWHVNIPELDLSLTVKAAKDEQEIVAQFAQMNRYEGESTVTGVMGGKNVTGSCCIELVGDWSK